MERNQMHRVIITTHESAHFVLCFADVSFSKFGLHCGKRDYALRANPVDKMMQHPTQMTNIEVHDVEHASKLWIPRPAMRTKG